MRLGIIARSDNTGLGNQTRELVNMLNPDKILLINSAPFNKNKQHPEWYEGYNFYSTKGGMPTTKEIIWFLKDVDVVISCETFYHLDLVDLARQQGTKTILQYNYELFGNLTNPNWSLPDVLLSPSLWNIDIVKEKFGSACDVIHLPPPTNESLFNKAKDNNLSKDHNRILHIAGKKAAKDRNGTETVLQMLKYSKANYELVITTQKFPELNLKALTEAFAERVLVQLHKRELITDDIVAQILSQDHSGFGVWMGDPFHDKESEQFVARYIERGPLALDKLSIQDDIVTYTTKDQVAHEFDALEFLATLSCHIPKPYESITRYYGRYSCRRRGERAKLATTDEAEITESDYRREFAQSSWAACVKRIYEIDPLECPKCKAQMRIVAFIQDEHSIKDIMQSQGIPDFQAPPPIPRFIETSEAIDEIPSYDEFQPFPDDC